MLICLLTATAATSPATDQPGLLKSEFIFETAPFPSCHASTIVETKAGLVAAWFGGTAERNPDVGIWVSRLGTQGWTRPVEVANGVQSASTRFPCWNPVLFQPKAGPLLLFYKVGPNPREWWGMLRTSVDGGRTWSDAQRLPEGILGPIKNKPLQLRNGDILCPSSTEDKGWRIHFERTPDLGRTWEKVEPRRPEPPISAIQPSLLTFSGGVLEAVGRSRHGRIFEAWSTDNGRTWGEPTTLTMLPNPNSGTDAVTLRDGRQLLVYNHTEKGRTPLNVAVSDDGRIWQAALVLESSPGEYSYPAVIQTRDRKVHITYTWKRQRIVHAVLDPRKFRTRTMPGGNWPE